MPRPIIVPIPNSVRLTGPKRRFRRPAPSPAASARQTDNGLRANGSRRVGKGTARISVLGIQDTSDHLLPFAFSPPSYPAGRIKRHLRLALLNRWCGTSVVKGKGVSEREN